MCAQFGFGPKMSGVIQPLCVLILGVPPRQQGVHPSIVLPTLMIGDEMREAMLKRLAQGTIDRLSRRTVVCSCCQRSQTP